MVHVRRFLETTSMRGVPRAARSEHRCLRGVWVGAILVFLACCLWQVCLLLWDFFSYPVVLQTRVELINYSNPDVYPRITLCNLSPFRSDAHSQGAVSATQLRQDFNQALDRVTACDGVCTQAQWDSRLLMRRHLDGPLGMNQYHGVGVVRELGHTAERLVITCSETVTSGMTSLLVPCNESVQFDVVFHPALVNCFVTFIPSVETWNVGPTDGLSLILFLDHMKWGEDALPNAAEPFTPQLETHAAGVKLQLTAATDKPMWGLHSTLLNPGTHTLVTYKVTERRLLSEPWGFCIEAGSSEPRADVGSYCHARCVTERLQRICGCTDITQGEVEKANESFPFCGNVSHSWEQLLRHRNCITNNQNDVGQRCASECYEPCSSFSFETASSSSHWPSSTDVDGFWDYAVENSGFGQRLQDFYDQLVENSSTPDFTLKQYILSSNFLKVTVRMEGFEQLTLIDKPKYSIAAILSTVGAALNFWSGITLIILVELFDLLYRTVFADAAAHKSSEVVKVQPTKQ